VFFPNVVDLQKTAGGFRQTVVSYFLLRNAGVFDRRQDWARQQGL
jgi:hypothetical protein